MSVVFGGVTPHPPLLIPEIGKEALGRVRSSQECLRLFSKRLVEARPELLLMVTPHGPVFHDALSIFTVSKFKGDFRQFGVPQVKLEADNWIPLARRIVSEAQNSSFPLMELDEMSIYRLRLTPLLDHATMVPLFYFQEAGLSVPIVLISIGMLPYKELYKFGKLLLKCIKEEGKRTAMIASGDLSHRLIPDAPAGYDPIGAEFDKVVLDMLASGNFKDVLSIDETMIERAGECGFRPITIMCGAWEDLECTTSVLSYEGPFGVGYGVVLCEPAAVQTDKNEEWILSLAKTAVEKLIVTGEIISKPSDVPANFTKPGAVFVSLHKNGHLRGCIGSLEPTAPSLAEEVLQIAVKSATCDPRFTSVEQNELPDLTYSIDTISSPEKISNPSELDPKKFGVIVQFGDKKGVLLPDLPGIDTVEKQIGIAMEKAGITPAMPVELYRFTVTRYGKK